MKKNTDLVVWITGGGSGIGKAVAVEYARRGATVVISGRRLDALEAVTAGIQQQGGKATAVVCDVCSEPSCFAAVTTILEQFGHLDVAFANAGYGATGTVDTLDDATWRRQFDTNVFGLLNTVRAVLPALKESGGRLALTSSVMGFLSVKGNGPYAASKFAVRAIGETLAQELNGSGVSCTTVYPGFVESDIARVDNAGVYKAGRRETRPSFLLWKADKAARVIVRGIQCRRRELVFTAHGKAAVFLARHCSCLVAFVLRKAG